MALDREQLAQRVKAAREAIGLEQADLAARAQENGFGKTDIGRMERPNGQKAPPPLTPIRIEALARITGFPPAWFTEPDISKVFGISEPETSEVDRLRRDLRIELKAMAAQQKVERAAELAPLEARLSQLERAAQTSR